jgi:hypothetical protein
MKKLSELLAEFNLPLQRFTIESTDALSPENEYDMEGPVLKHYDNYSTMTAKTSLDIVMVAHCLKSYFFVKSQAVFLDIFINSWQKNLKVKPIIRHSLS